MARIRDWEGMRDMSARLLKERTGSRSASLRAMKWIPKRWIGCSESTIGTAEKMK
jgi:hypothetical protein